MALESVTHISDLVAANPVLTDSRSEGDDHIRNIKDALLRDFPNINAIVSATPAELNYLVGATSNIQTQLGNIDSSQYVNGSIDTIHIADLNITTAKIADVNVTTAKIADDAVTTAKVLDANITFAKIVSASATNKILGRVTGGAGAFEEVTLQTTLSSSDEAIPTSKAVRDDIVALVNAVGGFVAIASEVAFPNAHPDPDDGAGTVVSIANVGGVVVDGAGQSTTGRTVGGTTVTITGIPSTYQSTTITDGLGMQVISTSTLNTYTYHRIAAKEGDTNLVATSITNVNLVGGSIDNVNTVGASIADVNRYANEYTIASSAPGSPSAGDLWMDTTANILKYYTGSVFSGIISGLTDIVSDTTPQLGGDLNCNSSQIQWSKGADVASATALTLLTDGNYFDVTGTATITSFNTTAVGTQVKLHFDGACTLTHHATDLVLPSGANIVTAAGDEAEFIEYASADYRCTSYSRASGLALISTIANDAIDSQHYAAGSIDAEHMSANSVDSDQYVDASIDAAHLSETALYLDATPGTDHTAVGPQTNILTAGYSSAAMDLVYLGSASKWLEADADAAATSINLLGIALEAKTDTQAMLVALSGSFVRDDTWAWTPGVPLYISGTLGAMTATKPTGSGDIVRTVGYAVTADIIFFAPSSDYVTLA